MLEGEKGNGPKEIHDLRDFGALSVDNGHHCLVITGETYMPITPQRAPYGSSYRIPMNFSCVKGQKVFPRARGISRSVNKVNR